MKKPPNYTLNIIAALLFVLEVINILMWIIFKSGYPFYIRLISAFVLLFVVLIEIIIFVGFLMYLFRKKSKGNTVDSDD